MCWGYLKYLTSRQVSTRTSLKSSVMCNDILRSPIFLKCQHCICTLCLLNILEGRGKHETCCPHCGKGITSLEGITPSLYLNQLISNLVMKCNKCNTQYKLKENHLLQKHVTNCKKSPYMEDAKKYIKQMMDDSPLPNKSFTLNTGGSRIQLFFESTIFCRRIFFSSIVNCHSFLVHCRKKFIN